MTTDSRRWKLSRRPYRLHRRDMDITYFRPKMLGPEAEIENAVASQITDLFPSEDRQTWAAASLPIGAGMPDLVVVSFEPEVFGLAHVDMPSVEILAYLRAVRSAKLTTIAERLPQPRRVIVRCLDGLVEVEAVSEGAGTFTINPAWRDILPEIVTIEAKVKNWRDAVAQAARNRVFAHRSFVALPERVSLRVRAEPIFKQLGIGLLSVAGDRHVRVTRRPRRRQPRVWTYYYKLASILASHFPG